MIMDPWTALLARATAERQLAAEGRWEELAESTADRMRMAAALVPRPRAPASLGHGRGAVAGYAAAQSAPERRWVDDRA